MKTSELTGAALDWAVAKCEHDGAAVAWLLMWKQGGDKRFILNISNSPSTNWAQGGPIIERGGITVAKDGGKWLAMTQSNGIMQWGQSYLVAAMRCYVASKLGDEIEIPEELK